MISREGAIEGLRSEPVAAKYHLAVFVCLACNAVLCVLYPFYVVFTVDLLLISSIALIVKPRWGGYLLIFLVPVSRDSLYFTITGEWNFKISDAHINLLPLYTPFFIFTGVGFLLHKGGSLLPRGEGNPVSVIVPWMAVYAAITLFWSENVPHGLFQYYYLVTNIMLFVIIVSTMYSERYYRGIMWALVFSGLIEAVTSYCFRFADTSVFEREIFDGLVIGGRNYGGLLSIDGSPIQAHGFQEAHETAMLMNIFMGVSTGLFLTETSSKKRVFLAICFMLGLSVLIGTESRAGAAAFIAMAMFFMFFYRKTSKYFIRATVVFFAAVSVIYVVEQKVFSDMAGKEDTVMRLIMLGGKAVATGDVLDPELASKEGAGPGRRTIWGQGLSGLSQTWPFGLGIGNYKFIYKAPHAHSVPFSVLFDFGAVGFILFILILVAIVRYYLKAMRHGQGAMPLCMMSTLMAVAFQGCFDFDYTYPLIWLFGGLLLSTLMTAVRHDNQ